MTGAEFYAYILRRFKRTDKSTEVYEAITDVIMDIKLRYYFEDFKEEAYTASIASVGDYKLSLPSDFQHLLSNVIVIDTNGDGHPLTKLDKETFDSKFPNPNNANVITALPKFFCLFSGQILLGHVPDLTTYTYQMTYTTEAAETITTDTASVPFTARNRATLRDLVLSTLYYGMGLDDEGEKYERLGKEGLALMIANEEYNIDAPTQQNYQDL